MDTFEFQPTEGLGGREAAEGVETRALEAATFEAEAFVEWSGEFQQAEVLQISLEAVTASLTTERAPSGEVSSELIPVDAGEVTEGASGESPGVMPGNDAGSGPGPDPGKIAEGIPGPGEEHSPTMPEATSPLPTPREGSEPDFKYEEPDRSTGEVSLKLDGQLTERVEIPLPGTGEAGFKEAPERLDVELPVQAEPLTGVGARGNVDATQGFATDLPLGIPAIDVMPGTGVDRGGTPKAVGNMPMGGVKMEGDSMIPDLGIPGIPTSGGPHSSGSGPAMRGGMGGMADGKDGTTGTENETGNVYFIEVEGSSSSACDNMADKASEMIGGSEDGVIMECSTGDDTWDYYIDSDGWSANKADIPKKSQEPDDSNPHPYTGGSMGPVTPEKDNDTGRILPDADLDGLDGTIWKGTPDSDDSGRFYGGIFGDDGKVYPDSGGARPIDPVRKTEDEANTEDETG